MCLEKSAVQRDMAGLTKVLPAPDKATVLLFDELHPLRLTNAATATRAATLRLDMRLLHRCFWG